MNLPPIVALCSPQMQAGKSEVAKYLSRTYVRGTPPLPGKKLPTFKDTADYQRAKFADPLKAMCRSLLVLAYDSRTVEEMLEGTLKEVPLEPLCGTSARHIMQTLGTEWGRGMIHPDLWTTMAMARVDKMLAETGTYATRPPRVVLDDLRFPNEMAAVLDRGGLIVRIERPGAKPYAAHASEGALASVTMLTIVNDGTLLDLHRRVDEAILGKVPANG